MGDDGNTSGREALDLEFEDSDREMRQDASNSHKTPPVREMLSPPLTKQRRKSKRTQPDRRVTVSWSREENEEYRCTLRDNTRDLAQEFNFASEEDFRRLMENDNGQLFRAIKHVLSAYQNLDTTSESLQQDLTLVTADKDRLETRVEAQKQKIQDLSKERRNAATRVEELEDLIGTREDEVAKLRRSRNAHRDNCERADARVKSLLIDKETLEKTIEGFEHRLRNAELHMPMEDSDREELRPRAWDSRAPGNTAMGSGGFRRILRRDELLTDQRPQERHSGDIPPPPKHKYPDLSLFYGDAAEWESWKAHLLTKVQTDYYDFPTEWNKVNYARDKTRGTAQSTIWHRAKPDSTEPYETLGQLIEDLNNVYGEEEQDKHRALLQQLFSPGFAMGARDRFETFEKFLARFTSTISPLRLTSNDKITHLFRNLSEQITERIYHLNGVSEYSEYVKGVRQVANQMKIRNEMKHNTVTSGFNARGRTRTTGEVVRKDTGIKKPVQERPKTKERGRISNMLARLPAHIRNKLRKEGRCFKCGGKGHISTDVGAPCEHEEQITEQKVQALLSELGIEWTEADFVYFDDPGAESDYTEDDSVQEGQYTQSEN